MVLVPKTLFFVFSCLLSLIIIWPILIPFFVGVTLAYIFEIPYFLLCQRPSIIRLKRAMSRKSMPSEWITWSLAVLLVFLILLGVLTPLLLAAYLTIQEIVQLLDGQETQALSEFIRNQSHVISDFLGEYGVVFSASELIDRVKEVFSSLGRQFIENGAQMATFAPQITLDVIIIMLTWTVFLVHGRSLRKKALPLIIPWREQRELLCKTTGEVVKALIIANIVVSFLQALVATAILGLGGIPRSYVWGFLAFFLSFVPVVGTAPIMIGGSLYAFLHGKPVSGVIVMIGAIVVAMVDNVLRPMLMKSSGSLSFYWLFTALLGGIAQFGLIGAVLGPLAFSLCLAAYNGYTSKKSGEIFEEPF